MSIDLDLNNKSATAAADATITNFINNVGNLFGGNNDGDRAKWVQKVHKHFESTYPGHGIMVIHKGQVAINAKPNSFSHFHLEFKKTFGTEGFEIYVVKKGSGTVITNTGDGGYINWSYSGAQKRSGQSVTF